MNKTVMIIDDSPDDIELARVAIEKSGYDVNIETCLSGESAMQCLRDSKVIPALILLDLKMPGMGGIRTLQGIRADVRFNRIPVIVVTSSSLQSDENDSLASRADGYLHKAFDVEQFSGDLKSVFDRWLT